MMHIATRKRKLVTTGTVFFAPHSRRHERARCRSVCTDIAYCCAQFREEQRKIPAQETLRVVVMVLLGPGGSFKAWDGRCEAGDYR